MSVRQVDPRLRGFAKSMRTAMTEAELCLWTQLRRHALDGLKFRRQVPIGPFILDFFCPEKRLIVELDGAQHFDGAAIATDAARTSWLEAQGYRLLRFSNLDVLENIGGVCSAITEGTRSRPP